jgi:DNA-binding SARP family transcriptional activator
MSAFLRLFGGLRLEAEGLAPLVRALQKKRLALLAVIGSSPTARSSRDKLVGLLWPDTDTDRARHQLASAVYDLRKALGEHAIVATADQLSVDHSAIRVDSAEFQDAIASGDRVRAVSLYAGPFLDGFYLSDAPGLERWVDGERSRLGRLYAEALESLAVEAAASGDPVRAGEWWRKLAAHDPYNSRIALGLISALEAAGDRAGALRHARIHGELLVAELGAQPDPDVAALAQRLRSAPARPASTPAVGDDGRTAHGARLLPADRSIASPTSHPDARGPIVVHRRIPVAAIAVAVLLLGLVAIAGAKAWTRDQRVAAAAPRSRPIVLMMDSPHPSRVYDEEIVAGSGTNADVINDLLRDLPIQRVKETAGPLWHRHQEIRELDPDLVVIHLSAFCDDVCEPERVKMRRFIEYLADGRGQFLIYSRMPSDTLAGAFATMMGDLPQRFPALPSRIHVISVVQYGPPHWKDPATAAELKLQVKSLLHLK